MPIPTYLLERIRSSGLSGPHVANVFAQMARAADEGGFEQCSVKLEYVGDDDQPVPGDLIPMITFSIVRHPAAEPGPPAPETVVDDNDSHSEE